MTAQFPKQRPDLFWLVIGLIVLAFCLSSCSTVRYCNNCLEKCKPTSSKDTVTIEKSDSSHTHVDTSYFNYHNPEDSLKLADNLSAYMDSLGQCKVKNETGSVESGKIKIKYIIRNDSIFIEANTKAYDLKIAQLNTTIDHYKSYIEKRYHSEQNLIRTKNKTWWSFWQTYVVLALLLFIFIKGIFKRLGLRFAFVPAFPFITVVPIIKQSG